MALRCPRALALPSPRVGQVVAGDAPLLPATELLASATSLASWNHTALAPAAVITDTDTDTVTRPHRWDPLQRKLSSAC